MTRARIHINISFLLAVIALLSPSFLLSSCSSSDDGMNEPTPQDKQQEIRFNPGVWNFMEGTRAAFYDTGTLSSGSFTAAAYVAESATAYINPVTVNWDTDKWVFSDGKHYWPASGSLDFFAYMPASIPSYITDNSDAASNVTYVARNPQFKCKNLPMTNTGQNSDLKEFVYALQTGRTKALDGAAGVTLNFQHPFARINLLLSSSQADIHINSITFKSIKNNGSYAHNSGWSPSGDATDFVATLDGDYVANANLGSFIMIPQSWAGEIEVNASWNDWGDSPVPHKVTTTIPAITWAAGTSYTYTFTISPDDLTVNTTNYTEQW